MSKTCKESVTMVVVLKIIEIRWDKWSCYAKLLVCQEI